MSRKHLEEIYKRLHKTKAVAKYLGKTEYTIRLWRRNGVPKIRRELVAVKLLDLMLGE